MNGEESGFTRLQDTWFACDDFLAMAAKSPDNMALTVQGKSYPYGEMLRAVRIIAREIAAYEQTGTAPLVAIYADRSFVSYASVLAAAMRGCAYVPLSPKSSTQRNGTILACSGAFCLLHQPGSAPQVTSIGAASTALVPLLCLDANTLEQEAQDLPERVHNSPHAYYLFTSGSTGTPKGVMFRRSNLKAYLDAVSSMTDYGPSDRVSQNFDLTFDLSVHDLFVTWRAGAHLFVPSMAENDDPVAFIRKHDLTCYLAVPTMARKMMLQGRLEPGGLSSLRLSLFCGEALPTDLARAWAKATTHRVENWYGPTETQSVMRYPFPVNLNDIEGQFDITPIGCAFPGMTMTVVDENMIEVPQGELGELLISGPQVSDGYLDDPEKTKAAFITRKDHEGIFYRTGDKVLVDKKGSVQFIDRFDNQIKIRGYRVELGEIETRLRDAGDGRAVIVVPIPLKSPTPTALAAAIENYPSDCRALLKSATESLPEYMRPTRLLAFEQFPTSTAGKVDRGQIGQMVAAELDIIPKGPKKAKAATTAELETADEAALKRVRTIRRRKRLMKIIIGINPTLSRADVIDADNLMDAGLDSLGFVAFTVELERIFGVDLDQEGVSKLSNLPFKKIAKRVSLLEKPPGWRSKRNLLKAKPLHERARRAISFLDHFPELAKTSEKPLAVFVGSSGFGRGIAVPVVEKRARRAGQDILAVNAGMGALNMEGIAQLCEFVRDTSQSVGKRLAWGVVEIDVMHLSSLPPYGDEEVVNDYLNGRIEVPAKAAEAGSDWPIATRGTMPRRSKKEAAPIEPKWMTRRNNEIQRAYLGQLEMDEDALAILVRGVRALAEVSDQVAMVVQPLNHPDIATERAALKGNLYDKLMDNLRALTGALVIEDHHFQLDPDDFLDRNHMNFARGRTRYSAQIADQIIAASKKR